MRVATDQYCTTPAGRVAYATVGSGPYLVCESGWVSHLLRQPELTAFGSFLAGLAERFTVIRYDKPGCGLSDRDGVDLSFDGQVAAALAVADAVCADRFSVFGSSQGGQLAVAIAAQRPNRVDALVVYGMCADGGELAPADVRNSIVALVRAHWGLGLKALVGAFVTHPTADELAAFTELQHASASAEVACAQAQAGSGALVVGAGPAAQRPWILWSGSAARLGSPSCCDLAMIR